jgi:hypothetical protein
MTTKILPGIFYKIYSRAGFKRIRSFLMNKKLLFSGMLIGLLTFGVLLSGCMSMKGSSWQKVDMTVQASKSGIDFELVDSKGKVVASGQTPYVVQLRPQSFNGAYTLRFLDKDGKPASQTVKGKFNMGFGAMLGDWLFPGLIVGYVIDAATGNIWKMPSLVNMQGVNYNPDAGQSFFIATLDDISPEARQYLIPVETDNLEY